MITPEGAETVSPAQQKMKFCTFMWVYYGYTTSTYEGINVEEMRYRCGEKLAERDDVRTDMVAGVPDSGTAHAVGYATGPGFRLPAHSLSIPLLGPVPLCRPTRPSAI